MAASPVVALLMVIIAIDSIKQAARAATGYAELQRNKLSAVCGPCAP